MYNLCSKRIAREFAYLSVHTKCARLGLRDAYLLEVVRGK